VSGFGFTAPHPVRKTARAMEATRGTGRSADFGMAVFMAVEWSIEVSSG
jgi:hypothetical protein